MLKKLKITTCTFTLCLFGLTLITVSPVFAEDSPEFIACQQQFGIKAKKNCFKNLARAYEQAGRLDCVTTPVTVDNRQHKIESDIHTAMMTYFATEQAAANDDKTIKEWGRAGWIHFPSKNSYIWIGPYECGKNGVCTYAE